MPNVYVAVPASSAPIDRLALGVGWVRPGASGIGCVVNPTSSTLGYGVCGCYCLADE